jgi:para-aminobenzoate synthetase component I
MDRRSVDNPAMSTRQGGSPPAVAARFPQLVRERLPVLDGVAPIDAAEGFRDLPGLGLLESARSGRAGRWSILVADPLDVLVGASVGSDPFADARRALRRLDDTRLPVGSVPFAGGLVGHLAYDLGRCFEAIPSLASDDQAMPDLQLGLHSWAVVWDQRDGRAWIAGRAVDADVAELARTIAAVRERAAAIARTRVAADEPTGREAGVVPPSPIAFVSGIDRTAWDRGVEAVRGAIAAGELYQANLARRLAAPFDGDPWAIYRRLRAGEPATFAAYLDLGRGPERPHGAAGAGPKKPRGPAGATWESPRGAEAVPGTGDVRPDVTRSLEEARGRRAIVSASPEPFVSLDAAGAVRADPIKGTRPRGLTRAEDRALAAELLASAKDRAENTMIVDVLRNDLGRVCQPGSVRAPRLWRLERTSSVQHLVSTIAGRLASGRDAFDLLAATFPGGSITGAPKIRAMELIEALEPVRRGPYCGAALWVDAAGGMGSSILIRTFVADGLRLTFHVGGGITWRSDAAAEWEETRTKARGPLRAIGGRVVGEEEP